MSKDLKIAAAILAIVACAFLTVRLVTLVLDLVTVAITMALVFAQTVLV